MNAPVRRLSLVVAALFASLLVSTTLIQYVFAADLNARPDNRRTLLSTFARERGDILVGQEPVARSVPSDDEYKFQRFYDDPGLYAHVTGYYSFFGANGGLEQSEDPFLSGSSDRLFYRRVSDLFTGRRPQGATLQSTIDPAVQRAAAEALGEQRGAAVALDPRTGA
ncbi:MAG: penicillin-binding protein 2, partial [Phycicoccus sp.]